jgi:DNA-binding response OmpR family regulator
MTETKALVLVVEDEEAMRAGLVHNLEYEGYRTLSAITGREALERLRKTPPDLVLLDVMLPEMNGFDVLRELRLSHPKLPVILLTSKGLETDKLQGFKLGADDYVTKPFSIQELLARVQAVLKRASGGGADSAHVVLFGEVEVDLAQREVRRSGQMVPLALKEYEMLRLFLRRRGEIVTREQLLHEVWGYSPDNAPTTRTVDNHVAKLRSKIGNDYIVTVQKVGYKLVG